MPVDPGGRKRKTFLPPKPKPKPREKPRYADAVDLSHATVREENIKRGAAPTGGPGRVSRARAERVTRRANEGKATAREVQLLLRKEGFNIPADNVWGPKTQDAWKRYRTAQLQGEAANLQEKAERKARADYIRQSQAVWRNRAREAYTPRGRGPESAEERFRAEIGNQKQGWTPERDELMRNRDALGDLADRAVRELPPAIAKRYAEEIRKDPKLLLAPQMPVFGAQNRSVQELAIGPELTKAMHGEDFDPVWATIEAAMILPGLGVIGGAGNKILRLAKTAKTAKLSARQGEKLKEGILKHYRAQGPSARPQGTGPPLAPEPVELPLGELAPASRQGLVNPGLPGAPQLPSRDIAKRVLAESKKVPEHLKTPGKLQKAIDSITEMALNGASGRGWYSLMAREAEEIGTKTGTDPKLVLQLLAIFSTEASPTTAVGHTLTALAQRARDQATKAGRYPNAQGVEADEAFLGQFLPRGDAKKRRHYYANALEELDPKAYAELGKSGHVTVDRWVERMFGLDGDKGKHYDFMERVIQEVANGLGWKPKEVQAAAWATIRSRGMVKAEANRAKGLGQENRGISERDALAQSFESHRPGIEKNQARFNEAASVEHGVQATLRDGGYTWNSDLSPAEIPEGFGASFDAYNVQVDPLKFNAQSVKSFREGYAGLFQADPELKIGSWYDPEARKVHLDITQVFPSEAEAAEFAARENQQAFFDFGKGEVKYVQDPPGSGPVREEDIDSLFPKDEMVDGELRLADEVFGPNEFDDAAREMAQEAAGLNPETEHSVWEIITKIIDDPAWDATDVQMTRTMDEIATEIEMSMQDESRSFLSAINLAKEARGRGLTDAFKGHFDRLLDNLNDLQRQRAQQAIKEPMEERPVPLIGNELFAKDTDPSIIKAYDNVVGDNPEMLHEQGLGAAVSQAVKVEDYETAQTLHNMLVGHTWAPVRTFRSGLYYKKLLRGADRDVLKAIPRKPLADDLGRAMWVAIEKGDINSATILQQELENVSKDALRDMGPQAFFTGGLRPQGRRSVTLGNKTVQFPQSDTWITAHGQRMLDRFSERLTGKVTALRDSNSSLKRAYGKSLTNMSARSRVAKQGGKNVRKEAKRRSALRQEQFRALRPRSFNRSEGEQMAHFWYAQMPAEHRNAEGLLKVREGLREELDYYTSGRAEADIHDRMLGIKDEIKAARADDDTTLAFELMGEQKKLAAIGADILDRVKDLSVNIEKLGTVIDNPVKLDNEKIDALRILMDERTDIFIRAGKLDPEFAAERPGLVSRWLGLEASGEEIYMGHRLGRVTGSRASGLPAGASVGKTRLPQGVATQNKLELVKTGRVRQSLEAAIEDWQAAQVYEFHNIAKDELADMGTSLAEFPGLRPKAGYTVINRKGHMIPRHWHVDQEAKLIEEGGDPEKILIDDIEEYAHNYMASGEDADRLIEAAKKWGHLEDLYVVPDDVVAKYYGQFLTPRITAATPGIKKGASKVGKTLDFVNDAIYTSLIYANPGYIPANSMANLIMAGLHQGAFLPVNLARSGQILTAGPQQLRDLLRAEVGHGASMAAGSGSVLQYGAQQIGKITDDPYRISAFLHEAAKEGIIPKTKPHLSEQDYANLMKFLTDERYRPQLNDISDRAVQVMVDFERLGPHEKMLAKRVLFVWSWIRGATRYPFRFALDHPGRSSLLVYGAMGAPGAPVDLEPITEWDENGMPPWLSGAISVGEKSVNGELYPQIFPTRSISPISTPWETFSTLADRPGSRPFVESLNPGIQTVMNVLGKKTPWGAKSGSYGEAATLAGERLAPLYGLGKDLVDPPSPEEAGMYPEDTSRLGRMKRAFRVAPYAIDPEEAYKARVRLGMEGDAAELARHNLERDSKAVGLKVPKRALEDLEYKAELDKGYDDLTPVERAKKLVKLYDERHGGDRMTRYVERRIGDDERRARDFVGGFRSRLYPSLLRHQHRIEREEDRRLERAG